MLGVIVHAVTSRVDYYSSATWAYTCASALACSDLGWIGRFCVSIVRLRAATSRATSLYCSLSFVCPQKKLN